MKKTIMIDMDDVMTGGVFHEMVEEFLGYSVDLERLSSFYIQDALEERKGEFFDWFKKQNIYQKAELYEDVYDIMKKLNEQYDIYICTAYVWREVPESCGNILKHKYDFLYEELDFLSPKKYIFMDNKKLINADIKIDDRTKNLENANVKLLYTAYHNKTTSEEELKEQNIVRVNNWKEIGDILLK